MCGISNLECSGLTLREVVKCGILDTKDKKKIIKF